MSAEELLRGLPRSGLGRAAPAADLPRHRVALGDDPAGLLDGDLAAGGELGVDLPGGVGRADQLLAQPRGAGLGDRLALAVGPPVSEALGVSPVKALNLAAEANRCGRPIAATSSGAPTSAIPGRVRAGSSGSTLR
jgi:hypothetical protein